jgi:hypothetical protein
VCGQPSRLSLLWTLPTPQTTLLGCWDWVGNCLIRLPIGCGECAQIVVSIFRCRVQTLRIHAKKPEWEILYVFRMWSLGSLSPTIENAPENLCDCFKRNEILTLTSRNFCHFNADDGSTIFVILRNRYPHETIFDVLQQPYLSMESKVPIVGPRASI